METVEMKHETECEPGIVDKWMASELEQDLEQSAERSTERQANWPKAKVVLRDVKRGQFFRVCQVHSKTDDCVCVLTDEQPFRSLGEIQYVSILDGAHPIPNGEGIIMRGSEDDKVVILKMTTAPVFVRV